MLSDCPDLPGYAEGNFLQRDSAIRLKAHASNPGDGDRDVTLRWQLVDYGGEKSWGNPIEKQVTIPAGGTVSETVSVDLVATGCMLARASVWAGDREVDRSDLPITSLLSL